MNVLVVDDQKSARRTLSRILEQLPDIAVLEASTLDEAREALAAERVHVALVDIRLEEDLRNTDGLVLVQEIKRRFETIPICVTASGEMSLIREAMRAGAYDYILKDELCTEMVAPLLLGLRDKARLEQEVERLRARVAGAEIPGLVGASEAMQMLRAAIRRVALSDRPVLIVGPTGSGKEAVVRALHALGPSPEDLLLDLNCAAIPESLLESQLFGHERGAFTGADRRHAGYFSAVGHGTLFLDEVAELPMSLQAKLLRVLESGRFRAVGSTEEQTFRGRVIAATHRDLSERVRAGAFREDLYYRLAVIEIEVPPLDSHREDIPLLVAHFLRKQSRPMQLSTGAVEALMRRSWPGNVRQLRNLIDRLAVFAESDTVEAEDVARVSVAKIASAEQSLVRAARELLELPVKDKLAAMESALIAEALTRVEGNKSAAARLLGVHRKVIERRVGRGPDDDEDDGEP